MNNPVNCKTGEHFKTEIQQFYWRWQPAFQSFPFGLNFNIYYNDAHLQFCQSNVKIIPKQLAEGIPYLGNERKLETKQNPTYHFYISEHVHNWLR